MTRRLTATGRVTPDGIVVDRMAHQVTCPIPGTFQVHRYGERPVEGAAVYQYGNRLLVCEDHARKTGQGLYCWHIAMVTRYIEEHPKEAQ